MKMSLILLGVVKRCRDYEGVRSVLHHGFQLSIFGITEAHHYHILLLLSKHSGCSITFLVMPVYPDNQLLQISSNLFIKIISCKPI